MSMKTVFHGNFSDLILNIVSGILLQSETIEERTHFSSVHKFAKNLPNADFELGFFERG